MFDVDDSTRYNTYYHYRHGWNLQVSTIVMMIIYYSLCIYIYIDGFMNEFTISILCVYIDIISPVRYGTWNAIADITLWIMDYGLWTEE